MRKEKKECSVLSVAATTLVLGTMMVMCSVVSVCAVRNVYLVYINQVNDKQKVMYKKSEKDEFSRIRMIFILLNLGA